MKVLKNKNIFNLLIITVMVLLGIASYYTYLSYQKYITVQNNTKLSFFLDEVESALDKIESERIDSATYMVTQEKRSFQKLKKTRVSVDRVLAGLDTFVQHNSKYTIFNTQIKVITDELKNVRKEVDNLSEDYRNIFFYAYHSKVFGSFLEILKDISMAQKSKVMKSYLSMYEKYTELRENSVLENTGIYFVLLGSKKMRDADIVLWKQLMDQDILPRFYTLADSTVALKLKALLSVEEFNSIISEERDMILHEARKGEYSVSVIGWQNQINKKMDYFTQAQLLLYTEIGKIEQEYISSSRMVMTGYGMVALLLLFLLFKLFVIYNKKDKDKRISKDTLKDIELIFNKKSTK